MLSGVASRRWDAAVRILFQGLAGWAGSDWTFAVSFSIMLLRLIWLHELRFSVPVVAVDRSASFEKYRSELSS